MALNPCAECNASVSDKANACPQCGAPPMKPKKTKWWLWIPLALILAFLILGLIVGSSPEAQQRQSDRMSIEICNKNQQDPDLDRSTQRFIAEACEKMESDFRIKHGRNP